MGIRRSGALEACLGGDASREGGEVCGTIPNIMT